MIEAADLTAAWFEAVLATNHPGVRVARVDIRRLNEWTNTHVRVELSYDVDCGVPERLFVKLAPADAAKRKAFDSIAMGTREARFYERLAPVLDLRVPEPYGVLIEADAGFAIVVEDLRESGCSAFNARPVSADAAARALEDFAGMHVRYEEASSRAGDEVSWVEAPPLPSEPDPARPNIGATYLRHGIEQHRDKLGDAYVTIAERWIEDPVRFQALWWDAPPTVIHGDPHPGNLFDDHGRVGFLDWGLVALGDPLRDASYFLCLALDPDVRRAHERDLLRHYLDVRAATGGREIAWDDAWRRHRIHASYTVPASCQALVVPDDASERAREFSDTFLERAVAAVEDLEASDAVADAFAG